ncbi:MAG: NAD(P)/FAD-dependent oxidoreductase [Solirubrobacterales bacterium]|nr:NAD(P)/FAD-dependent oxidoreductase [Solirubrobacterales bacterium]
MDRPDHHVVIVGAGLSGIGMGIALRRAGIEDFVIFERAGDIGGTWRDNVYPGIGVDIPAQAYQFSYELKPDWSRVFAKGHEVKEYVDACADRYGVRAHVRCYSDVSGRAWDEEGHRWRLRVGGREVTARFVISAVGPFVEPKASTIAGLEDFGGKVIHSARWDTGYDLTGRRVAIVGTGASAVQIIPEIARSVERLDVYQRTPIWVGPKFDPATPRLLEALYRRVPAVQRAVRAATTRGVEAGLVTAVLRHDRIGPITRGLAWLAREVWYRRQVPDPELRRRLTPDYDIGCKRPAVSNDYLRTFTRKNVELVTDPIERVTARGVRTRDGAERDVDVLVLATGFWLATDPEAFEGRPVRGRAGFDLARSYAESRARSYESVSVPGLPNHFMIFGPYGWTGGSWHVLVEVASTHIVRVLKEAARREATAVEVVPEAADRWTRFAVERLGRSLWRTGSCATANSYYFDRHGDTPFLRPTSSTQARRASRTFPLEDYEFTVAGG